MTNLSGSRASPIETGTRDVALERFVLMHQHDGIGGRLANIFHGWRLAQSLGIRCIVGWPRYYLYYDADALLTDFFDLTGFCGFSVIEELDEIDSLLSTPNMFEISKHNPIKEAPFDAFSYRFCGTGAYPMTGENLDEIERHASRLARSVPLNPAVAAAMHAIHEQWDFSDCVALHVRRGDIVKNFDMAKEDAEIRLLAHTLWMRLVDVHSYVAAVKAMEIAGPLFVFSNDQNEIAKLRGLVSNDIVTVDDLRHHLAGLTEAQRDFTELVLMAECQSIIAPGWSNYSGFAMTMGGIKRHSVQEWIQPAHTIDTIEEIFPDRSYILGLMFDGYAAAMKKRKRHLEAETFTQRAEYHRLRA